MNSLQSHCSGHSKGSDLFEIVKTINAKMLFPIHTEHPDAFKTVSKNLVTVEEGKEYKI